MANDIRTEMARAEAKLIAETDPEYAARLQDTSYAGFRSKGIHAVGHTGTCLCAEIRSPQGDNQRDEVHPLTVELHVTQVVMLAELADKFQVDTRDSRNSFYEGDYQGCRVLVRLLGSKQEYLRAKVGNLVDLKIMHNPPTSTQPEFYLIQFGRAQHSLRDGQVVFNEDQRGELVVRPLVYKDNQPYFG